MLHNTKLDLWILIMVQYNPEDWFTFIFRTHKSDNNDLPMKSMAKNIYKHVSEIFTADSQK